MDNKKQIKKKKECIMKKDCLYRGTKKCSTCKDGAHYEWDYTQINSYGE